MYGEFGAVGRHEGKPENGPATSLVGDPDTLWVDNNEATYATFQGGGFENPWGHPYARMLSLPLSQSLAMLVTDVLVTWTARQISPDPSNPTFAEPACSPVLRWGSGDPGYAGLSYHSLGICAWHGNDEDSLIEGSYEGTFLPLDGSSRTFTDRMVPAYSDRSLQQILSRSLGSTYAPSGWDDDTIDAQNMYVIGYQDSFWTMEKFAISDISFELVGLTPETVIGAGRIAGRARFT